MSNVIRPSGPLPARVYWVRRLLLVGIVVLVAALAWWLVSGLGGSSPNSGSPKDASLAGAATQSSGPPPTVPSTSSSQPPPVTHSATTRARHHATRGGRHHSTQHQSPALPAPTGDCAPSDVGIDVQVSDTKVGESMPVTLALTTLDSTACTLQITPATLVLRITSGADVIWTSDDCPNLLPARQVVLRGDPATSYRFTWDGHRSVQGCISPGQLADPGGYWVEAALVGADVHKAYFDVKS
jgi:hypothetical protein